MVQPAQAQNEAVERLQCNWCQGINLKTALSCQFCGAPLDLKDVVSELGWREAPRLKDMTEFHISNSACQVEGEIVPVAEINIGQGDAFYFEHHVMLWKDPTVPMSVLQLPGGMKRVLAGMPFIISVAQGPGRSRVLARCHRRIGCASASSRNGIGCARTRFPVGFRQHHIFL